MLTLLRGALSDDPTVMGDKGTLRDVQRLPIAELCSTDIAAIE
jgi:hypothetical protein